MSTVSALGQSGSTSYNAVYSDVKGLQSIRQLGQSDQAAALSEVSKQFESILVNMMLKQMRSATNVLAEGSYLGGDKVGFYQEMLDDQLSIELTKRDGLGFAETLAGQLGGGAADLKTANADAQQGLPIEQALLAARLGSHSAIASSKDSTQAENSASLRTDSTAYTTSLAAIRPYTGQSILSDPSAAGSVSFASPQEFVQSLYPHAERAANKLGVAPEALLAQAALETGWGQHMPAGKQGEQSFNLFGIKADQRWAGDTTQVDTLEYLSGQPVKVNASFRNYQSFEQSFNDYVDFVSSQSRYQAAVDNAADPKAYITELHKAGYATDPLYAEKIQQILARDEFKRDVHNTVSTQLPQG